MNAREEWLNARRSGIGGSDVAAILGLSPWRTPVDVYLDKTGQAEHTPENEAMHWGTVLEDVVARHYAEANGRKVQRINKIIRHPERDWMLANIDRAIVAPGSRARFDAGVLRGADGLLEVKTTSAYKAEDWRGDDLPLYYTAQVIWYMAITGMPWSDVAVLIGGNHYQQRRVEFDSAVATEIIERCEAFWRGNVLAGIAPEPVSAADVVKLYPQDCGESIEADADLLPLIIQARDLRQSIKADETALETLTDAIKTRMCDASALTVQGQPVITWKAAKASLKTDWKAAFIDLQTSLGLSSHEGPAFAAIEDNTQQQPGSRRFIWKD